MKIQAMSGTSFSPDLPGKMGDKVKSYITFSTYMDNLEQGKDRLKRALDELG